jgi:hypothetical protein
LGTDAWEDVFFRLDPRSSDFPGSGLHRGKRLAIEGLVLGDSESSLSYTKMKEFFSCSKFDAKGSAAKPLELLKTSSFL